jgi:hypothetical protein
MAKRRSTEDAGAKQDATPFDYSEAEWSEIEAAARSVLPDGKSLPNEVRKALVERARTYRVGIRMRPLATQRRDWQKVMHLSERLIEALLVVCERGVQYFEIHGHPEEGEKFGREFEDHFRKILEVKFVAKVMAAPPPPEADLVPARVGYQFDVLQVWIRLGGKLQFSRHPKTRKPQGPLIRFFRAVTNPVMGASAPSLESLPDIIRREKRVLQAAAGVFFNKRALQKS